MTTAAEYFEALQKDFFVRGLTVEQAADMFEQAQVPLRELEGDGPLRYSMVPHSVITIAKLKDGWRVDWPGHAWFGRPRPFHRPTYSTLHLGAFCSACGVFLGSPVLPEPCPVLNPREAR